MIVKRAVDDRKGIIGASSIGAMLELSRWATPYQVWREAVRGEKPQHSEEELRRFEIGHRLEGFVSKLLEEQYAPLETLVWQDQDEETGEEFLNFSPPAFQCEREGMEFLLCHPDRVMAERDENGETVRVIPVEIKTSSAHLDHLWGEEGTDQVPYEYLLQCWGYFLCGVGSYAVYTGRDGELHPDPEPKEVWLVRWADNRLTKYIIPRPSDEDLEFFASEIKEVWDSWQRGEVPEPSSFEEATDLFPPKEGAERKASEDEAKALSVLREKETLKKSLEREIDDLKKEIVVSLEGVETLTYQGEVLCTYKEQSTHRFDVKAFRAANPELAAKFSRLFPSRILRIKGESK